MKKEDVPDVTEAQCHAIKRRSLDSVANFDYLNDDVDALCQCREQIIWRKDAPEVLKYNSMNILSRWWRWFVF